MNRQEEDKDWERVRSTLGMPFPNLPYLIDTSESNSIELTQSNAILRYLARRYNFYGDSESERAAIDVLQDQAYDFRNEIIKTAYTLGEEYTDVYKYFASQTLPKYLDSFETYLLGSGDTSFFVGRRLSLVDFVLYELLWQMTLMVPQSITASNRPALCAFIEHFESNPQIDAYTRSENYIKHPVNSPWASFT